MSTSPLRTPASPSTSSTDVPPTTLAVEPPVGGGIAQLVVAAPRPEGYDRDLFKHWIDDDHDCQDARAEALIAESRTPVALSANSCSVVSGEWVSPWSGIVGSVARSLDVDHTVPLANAWRSGAWSWTPAQRRAFANDLADQGQLIALPASENRAKSDDGPESWRPADPATWCAYAQLWTQIKARWNLTASPEEWTALTEMGTTCAA